MIAVDSDGLRVLLFVTNRADRRGGLSHAEISAEVKQKDLQVHFCLDHPSTVSLCFAGRHLELLCLRWSPAPVGGGEPTSTRSAGDPAAVVGAAGAREGKGHLKSTEMSRPARGSPATALHGSAISSAIK